MAWPGITDFSEAVQNPGLCFRGTDLEGAEVSVNRMGMPLLYSGAFACVYRVTAGDQAIAVRCFTREVSDQHERYDQLSGYLMGALPPSFVDFQYVKSGISVRGSWYPVVRMEWVDGSPLSGFVAESLDDPDALLRLAAQWRGGPAASLRGLGIAHNDLQHGNVMVQPDGRIRLVDYDGMFLPAFRGQRSPELGHKNFQHPARTAEDYDAHLDNFPSLVIYLSLLAVATDPDLWSFFNDDNLIFTRQDYADPAGSALFDRLRRSSEPAVAELARRLEECCSLALDEVPDLETVLDGIPPVAAAAKPTGAAGAGGRAPAPAPPGPQAPTAATPSQPAAPPQASASPPRTAAPVPQPPGAGPMAGAICPNCRRTNSLAAAICAGCWSPLNAPAAPPGPAAPAAPVAGAGPPVGIATRLRSWASGGFGPGEIRRVLTWVAVTVAVVTAGLAAAIAAAVALQGW